MVPDLTHCMLASPSRERRWAWSCCFSWASASLACAQSLIARSLEAGGAHHLWVTWEVLVTWRRRVCVEHVPGHLWGLFPLSTSESAATRHHGRQGFSSVQFSRSVVSHSLRPHEPQHARPSCPSPTPRVHPNPCPLSRWCYPTISSSVVPVSSCPQSFPVSGSFPMSQLFASGGHSIGVSASASVLPMNTQDWWGRALIIGFVSLELELWKPGKSVWC